MNATPRAGASSAESAHAEKGPLVATASAALADVCAALSPAEHLGDNERHSLAQEIELIVRRAEVAAVLHAGHFAVTEAARGRSRTSTAANIAEATGCSRPQAHTRMDTFDLIATIAGKAFLDLRLTGIQARAIAAAREPYNKVLEATVLDKTEERIVRRAGTKSASTLKQEVQSALSPKLPSDGKDRQAQQRASRAARLYGQQSDGMSKLVLNVTPGTRSLLGGLSARASAARAKMAEDAVHAGRAPEDVSHEQAFHDLLVAQLAASEASHAAAHAAAGDAPKHSPSGAPEHSSTPAESAGTASGEPPTTAGPSSTALGAPVASIVIRLSPGDWHNLGTLVSTNSGAVVSVRDALDMATRGPSYLSTHLAGREQLFRIDEIDADAENSESRFANALQRLVLYAGAGGCRFPGCDEPAIRCQVHHIKPWNDGGRTTLDNLVLVCRAHHNRISGAPDGWSVRRDPGDPHAVHWERNSPPHRDGAEETA